MAKEIDQSRFQANVALFEQKISISGGFVEIGVIFEKFVVKKSFHKKSGWDARVFALEIGRQRGPFVFHLNGVD